MAELERLQKVLASRGVASRREAEELITAGRVTVDGRTVTELGTRVDPETAEIAVDGVPVTEQPLRYIMLNKPSGYITTMADERGRRTVTELVDVPERVVPVGRLDRPTEGLLLFTNDGELAHRVMHPRYEIEKEYDVLVDGFPPPEVLQELRRGIVIDGSRVVPSVVRPLRQTEDGTLIKLVIHEGRNRVIRRMFERVNYPVLKLVRTRIGPLQLGSLPRGAWRDLTPGELEQLKEAVKAHEPEHAPRKPPRRAGPRRSLRAAARPDRRRGRPGPVKGRRRSRPPRERRH